MPFLFHCFRSPHYIYLSHLLSLLLFMTVSVFHFLLFMTLTLLKNISWIFYRIFLNFNLSNIFSLLDWSFLLLFFSPKKYHRNEYSSQVIISRVYDVHMYYWWDFLLKCSWYIILCKFLVYNIVIQHLYIL